MERCPGSSPRLRGTLEMTVVVRQHDRFIPAPAGNTPLCPHILDLPTVHPRACGEHAMIRRMRLDLTGSSPRLRGTLRSAGFAAHGCRFIPAPAGNTPHCRMGRAGIWVHPRACGEHVGPLCCDETFFGSSPRLRGTRVLRGQARRNERFIPAPAGNTCVTQPTLS